MTAATCRRCDRPLVTDRSRRREIGPKCERLETAERAGHARRPSSRLGELDQVITDFPDLSTGERAGLESEGVAQQGKKDR